MYQVQAENGDVPNYGSNDGALIFPVNACGYRDFRPVLNTVYAQMKGARLYETADYDEEMLWFGVGEIQTDVIERKPSEFEDSGFYTLRHDGGYMMVCFQDFRSRPAHFDQLHIDLWHNRINVLCDSGTYSYASEFSTKLVSTVGYNTAKVTGIEQMNKHGAFLVYDWTSRKDVHHDDNSFSGTMVSKNGYTHKRQIHKTDLGYSIEDEVTGNSEYCEFLFHTPCEVFVEQSKFKLLNDGTLICEVECSGEIEIQKAMRSLYYLKQEEINCVHIKYCFTDGKCKTAFNIKFV
jgi:hypothetical protein